MEFKFRGTVLARVCEVCNGKGMLPPEHEKVAEWYFDDVWINMTSAYQCKECGGDGYNVTDAGRELEAFVELINKKYLKGY